MFYNKAMNGLGYILHFKTFFVIHSVFVIAKSSNYNIIFLFMDNKWHDVNIHYTCCMHRIFNYTA